MPSRGLTLLELLVNQLWRNGPEWLKDKASDERNTEDETLDMPEECVAEMRAKSQDQGAHNLLTTEGPPGLGGAINCQNYSTVLRLQRVTAYVLRAVKVFKRPHTIHSPDCKLPVLTIAELAEMEGLWITHSHAMLAQDKNFDHWKKQLGLFGPVAMWWKVRKCGLALLHQATGIASEESPIDGSDREGCSWMCSTPWGQGNSD